MFNPIPSNSLIQSLNSVCFTQSLRVLHSILSCHCTWFFDQIPSDNLTLLNDKILSFDYMFIFDPIPSNISISLFHFIAFFGPDAFKHLNPIIHSFSPDPFNHFNSFVPLHVVPWPDPFGQSVPFKGPDPFI